MDRQTNKWNRLHRTSLLGEKKSIWIFSVKFNCACLIYSILCHGGHTFTEDSQINSISVPRIPETFGQNNKTLLIQTEYISAREAANKPNSNQATGHSFSFAYSKTHMQLYTRYYFHLLEHEKRGSTIYMLTLNTKVLRPPVLTRKCHSRQSLKVPESNTEVSWTI